MPSLFSGGGETLVLFLVILTIAALGLYLPIAANQLDVAIPGYMALGAYSSALLTTKAGWTFITAIVVGGLLAAAAAILIDSLAMRVRATGFALSVISIGFFEVVQVALTNLDYVGGSAGLPGIPPYTTFTNAVGALVVIVVLLVILGRSRWGRVVRAIRDDELAAAASGIRLVRSKLWIFAAGAFIGGVAGAFYAHNALYIEPRFFSFALLTTLLLPVVFGGLQTMWGPIVGTFILGLLPEFVRPLQDYRLILTAGLTIAVVLLRPNGLISAHALRWAGARLRGFVPRRHEAPDAAPAAPAVRWVTPPAARNGKAVEGGAGAPLIELRDIRRHFGGVRALDGVSLTVDGAGIQAIIGPNGAGKSTLFDVMTGVVRPSGGEVLMCGVPIAGRDAAAISRMGLVRTFQTTRVFPQLSALDNVRIGAEWHPGADGGSPHERARAALRFVEVDGRQAERLAGELPLAQQRRVEVARALAGRPRVILLDEPMAGMNAGEKDDMTRLIRAVAGAGTKVVLVEHDMQLIMGLADSIALLNFGKVIATGSPAEVRANPVAVEAYLGREEEPV